MHTLCLDGIWHLCCHGQEGSGADSAIEAPVPGSVHDALLAAGLLADAHYGWEERNQLWVGDRTWIYRREFDWTAELLAAEHADLVLEGLDTFCSIFLNGRLVAKSDNMFRVWRFPVREFLCEGRNEIEFVFESAGAVMARGTFGRHLAAWNEFANSGSWGPTGRGYVRKQACQFGWDWGMQSPSAGPWGSVRIEAWDTARIDDWRVTQNHLQDGVGLRVFLQPTSGCDLAVRAELLFGGKVVASISEAFYGGWEWALDVPDPQLWWPNGLGSQPLYGLRLELLTVDGRLLDRREARIGLRHVELVREPDAYGRSFYFRVNGRPFFAKGANWIPLDAHASAKDLDARYRRDLGSARDAHMNMLRVWGGGYFPQDVFYDICDELGILVWQDLMFGCGAYPVWDAAFRQSVWLETVDNARRLRHHACLACWCGNNELEQGFTAPAWSSRHLAWASYEELFERVLPSALVLADPGTPYFRGSPHCAPEDGRDGTCERSGDFHLWEIWFSDAPFEVFRRYPHRFLSEFGFQSFPDAGVLRRFAPEGEELSQDSPWLSFRQRSAPGNARIVEKVDEWFGKCDRDFDDLCLLSQLVQGLGLKIGIEHWRRMFPRCGGATYWQLNDRWAAPTWSTLDVTGGWKASHHIAAQFFAPLSIIGIEDAATMSVETVLLNDHGVSIPGRVTIDVYAPDGKLVGHRELTASAAPESLPTRVGVFSIADICSREVRPSECMVWLRFEPDDRAWPTVENLVLFVRPGDLAHLPARLKWTFLTTGLETGLLQIENGPTPALWVHVKAHRSIQHVIGNYVCLRPGANHTIHLHLAKADEDMPFQVICALGRSCRASPQA